MKIAREDDPLNAGLLQIADPSAFACPECHGVLLRLKEADPMRFRCHTGHAYTADSLIAALNESIEDSLWNAVRALHEGTLLLRHLARHSSERGDHYAAENIAEQLASTSAQAEAVRDVVTNRTRLLATSNMRRDT